MSSREKKNHFCKFSFDCTYLLKQIWIGGMFYKTNGKLITYFSSTISIYKEIFHLFSSTKARNGVIQIQQNSTASHPIIQNMAGSWIGHNNSWKTSCWTAKSGSFPIWIQYAARQFHRQIKNLHLWRSALQFYPCFQLKSFRTEPANVSASGAPWNQSLTKN